jgi:hypothetical protein
MGLGYWKECISIAADDIGLTLTDGHLDYLAESVQGGFENYGMAHGHDCIRGESDESKELKKMKAEKEKYDLYISSTKPCPYCYDGTARDQYGRDCTCDLCDGLGRAKK